LGHFFNGVGTRLSVNSGYGSGYYTAFGQPHEARLARRWRLGRR